MEKPPFDHLAFMDQMLRLHGLSIEPAWRDGIAANVQTILRFAEHVLEFGVDEHAEPAPTFDAQRS